MKNFLVVLGVILFLAVSPADAHCDGVDGPVVQAAFKSLETKDISYVLIWIKKEHENTIRGAFEKTLKVRQLSKDAQEVADHHFLETVVRLHREGEGEPFTGIKAAGRDLGPVIPAADRSISSESLDELKEIITHKLMEELENKFTHLQEKKDFDIKDTEAGREYVQAYVEYLQFAENMYKLAFFTPHAGAEGTGSENHEVHKH